MTDDTAREKLIKVVYFVFTSLTTTGFGDFYPVSKLEKLIGSQFLLLFGVALFSYITGSLIQILKGY